MKIGEKTLRKGGEMLTNALITHQKKINEAFANGEDTEVKIGMSLSIKPSNKGDAAFNLKADVKFVTEQINDSFSASIDELQTDMFDKAENG
jgi:hypothetical protein